jgi:hypothetical protein
LPARIVPFHVVCMCNHWGFNEEALPPLRDIFNTSEADIWVFPNSGTLLAYFLANDDESQRAEQLVVRLSEFVAGNPRISNSGIGKSEGRLVAVFNWRGRIKTAPLGLAVNKAIARARNSTCQGPNIA